MSTCYVKDGYSYNVNPETRCLNERNKNMQVSISSNVADGKFARCHYDMFF